MALDQREQRRHRERNRASTTRPGRGAAARFTHQRMKACHQQWRSVFGRGGNGRVISENCTIRAGVGPTATTTRFDRAAGGAIRAFEQRERASVPHMDGGELQRPLVYLRDTLGFDEVKAYVQHGGASTAPLEVRRERIHESPSTKESGSSSSIGHSRSSACSNRSSGTAGTSGPGSSPRARRCHWTPDGRDERPTSSGGSSADRRACAAHWRNV